MFAPWCPTCSSRMLLGPRRILAIEPHPTGTQVVLRCFCEAVLVWSAAPSPGPAHAVTADRCGPDLHLAS